MEFLLGAHFGGMVLLFAAVLFGASEPRLREFSAFAWLCLIVFWPLVIPVALFSGRK